MIRQEESTQRIWVAINIRDLRKYMHLFTVSYEAGLLSYVNDNIRGGGGGRKGGGVGMFAWIIIISIWRNTEEKKRYCLLFFFNFCNWTNSSF